MSQVGCLLTRLEPFILFAENRQILLKIYVIPILLTFMYLVALNLLVNNHFNSSLRLIIVTKYCDEYFLLLKNNRSSFLNIVIVVSLKVL